MTQAMNPCFWYRDDVQIFIIYESYSWKKKSLTNAFTE